MRNPPGKYKTSDYGAYSKNGDGALLRKGFATGGMVSSGLGGNTAPANLDDLVPKAPANTTSVTDMLDSLGMSNPSVKKVKEMYARQKASDPPPKIPTLNDVSSSMTKSRG